jgi:guanylate kinase
MGEAPAFLVEDLQDGPLNGLELKNGICKTTTAVGDKTVRLYFMF